MRGGLSPVVPKLLPLGGVGRTSTERDGPMLDEFEELLAGRELMIVSNRGPFDFVELEDGFVQRRGAGGLVTVLSPVGRFIQPVWIAAARSEGDRRLAAEHGGEPVLVEEGDASYRLGFVDLPPEVYDGYYNVIANPLLWFTHHYMWDTPREPRLGPTEWRAWREGYVTANRSFAEVVSERIGRSRKPPVVMVQDYHLYLVPGEVRARRPEAFLEFFLHIPFPGLDYLRLLPAQMRNVIISSLLACDLVGFHTRRFAMNFLRAAGSFVPGTSVDYDEGTIERDGRRTVVRVYPAGIDPETVLAQARGEEAQRELEFLAPCLGERNIVRVDRIDPSKNLLRGFEAYDLLLEGHPELRERVKFLALLMPGRPGIEEYERYLDDVAHTVARINLRHGTDHWRPIEMFVGHNYARALAAMRHYDALLVNPLIDGMNVVAKEGVLVNERDGVLVLSESAGTHEQFAPLPCTVSPADVTGTAEALWTALAMPGPQRGELAQRLREKVCGEDVRHWLRSQLRDVRSMV